MTRLDDETFPDFVCKRGLGLVLIGSYSGKPTLAQSRVFANLWADRHADIRFGYVDALSCELARKHHNVRLLPTLLLVCDGCVIARLEGFHDRMRLEAALARPRIIEGARAA